MIKLLLGYIGAFSPIYMFFITLFLLRHKNLYFFYYIYGTITNIILNLLLKLIIKQPRPNEDYKVISIATANGERFGPDVYGMPSGHAQSGAFNFAYITFIFQNASLSCFYLIISFITLAQRYIYKNHTLLQLLVGLIIGLGMGYSVFKYTNTLIKGQLTHKKDDNGPI